MAPTANGTAGLSGAISGAPSGWTGRCRLSTGIPPKAERNRRSRLVTRLPPPIRIRDGRRAAVLQLKPAKVSSPSSRQLRARPNRPNRVFSRAPSVSEDNRYPAKQLGRTTRIGRSNIKTGRAQSIARSASQNGGLTRSPKLPHRVAVVGRLSGRRFSASRMPLLCRKILCARLRPRRGHYLAAAPMRPAPL